MSSPIRQGELYSPERTAEIIDQLNREGFAYLGPTLEPAEVDVLHDAMQRKWADPVMHDDAGNHIQGISMMRMFEYDNAFRDLIAREPFASLAEAVLGGDCHMLAQNALRTEPVESVQLGKSGGWHLDDLVHFPLNDEIERHDSRMIMPCMVLQVFTPLTDVDDVKFGPTEVVPGSHYAGRRPNDPYNPSFGGRKPMSILAKAGDAYLFNNQIWHRGAPNVSDRVRYLAGVTYSKRFVAQKLFPFIDYRMPEHVWQGADARLQRLLGRHEKGAYG
jgi:hypothetical protein